MNPPERFELSNNERFDPLWQKLSKHFESKINELRERNDAVDLTQEQTVAIRKEIEVYKKMLKL